jgi:hypothetical protein
VTFQHRRGAEAIVDEDEDEDEDEDGDGDEDGVGLSRALRGQLTRTLRPA